MNTLEKNDKIVLFLKLIFLWSGVSFTTGFKNVTLFVNSNVVSFASFTDVSIFFNTFFSAQTALLQHVCHKQPYSTILNRNL